MLRGFNVRRSISRSIWPPDVTHVLLGGPLYPRVADYNIHHTRAENATYMFLSGSKSCTFGQGMVKKFDSRGAYAILHHTRAEHTSFAFLYQEQKWHFQPGYGEIVYYTPRA